jgi:hypothetical protein
VLPPTVTPTRERSSADPGVDRLALALPSLSPSRPSPAFARVFPWAPHRRHLASEQATKWARHDLSPPPVAHVSRVSHRRHNPARPDPPLRSTAARRPGQRSGPHHNLAHVKNGLPPQKDGTLASRDLRIDERTDVVLAADQLRPVSASLLRRPRPDAHLAQDTFFRLQPPMSFDPQD